MCWEEFWGITGWRISSAETLRKGHVSRKCTGWHCEEVNCFPFQDPVWPPFQGRNAAFFLPDLWFSWEWTTFSSCRRPATRGCSETTELTDCLCQQGTLLSPHWPRAGSWKLPRQMSPFPAWTIQILCLPFLCSCSLPEAGWMPKPIPGYTIIVLMIIRNK